jgi:HrpA-like RNA helicase
LDANPDANIVVTQPRRISAVSIAERVAQEQCQDTVGKLIGYQVRLDTAKSEQTQLLFMTPGVLLRQMQSSPLLQQYSTIIIDEIHERDKYQEFLLIVLRDLIPLRPDLRVVLMSATLQTLTLVDYFSSAVKPAVVEMEGRMFPVQEFYLEHILELTKYVDGGGGEGGGGQVEAELAKLLAVQEEDAQTPTLLQCFMCGKKFTDGVELGAHVAMCGEDVAAIEDAATVDDVVGMDDEDEAGDTVVLDYSKLDDYDVDEELVCADYHVDKKMRENEPVVAMLDEETIDARPNSEGHASNDEAKVQKWDGESPFDADVGTGPVLTEGQENLLEQYQGMHDDEQIDNFLLLEIVRYIAKSSHGDGAILVFLPGWQEISEFSLLLDSSPPFRDHSKYLVLPLHSGIPSKDQRRVLQRPPQGTRKIVLSTNIAETSLTIDDVAFVVDTGRAKEKNYDPHLKTSTLQTTWISQASAKQRKGRAGRTKAGVCFHLFSSRRHASLRDFTESELLRTPLVRCASVKLCPSPFECVSHSTSL